MLIFKEVMKFMNLVVACKTDNAIVIYLSNPAVKYIDENTSFMQISGCPYY